MYRKMFKWKFRILLIQEFTEVSVEPLIRLMLWKLTKYPGCFPTFFTNSRVPGDSTFGSKSILNSVWLFPAFKLPLISSDMDKRTLSHPQKPWGRGWQNLPKGAKLQDLASPSEAAWQNLQSLHFIPVPDFPNHPKCTWDAFEVGLLLIACNTALALDLRGRGEHGAKFRSWWFHLHIRGQNKQIKTATQNEWNWNWLNTFLQNGF